MAQARCIHLTAEQVEELAWVRDHHQKTLSRMMLDKGGQSPWRKTLQKVANLGTIEVAAK